MSKWKGISHGRTTRAMEQILSPAEFKVVAVVRRLIPDGERRRISQATIAEKAKVSEGTVSRTMQKVDNVFFRRHFAGTGRGNGYEIEAIPLNEALMLSRLSAPNKGSLTDPSMESEIHPVDTPQTNEKKDSLRDPYIFYDHDHEQQQQQGSSEQPLADNQTAPNSPVAAQLAPETVAALDRAGAHPKLIRRIAECNPDCTPEDVAAALAAAHAKPQAHTPPGLALECLARAQRVVTPRAVAERPTRQQRPSGGEFDAEGVRQQVAPDEAPSVAPEPLPEPIPERPPRAASPALNQRWQLALAALRERMKPGEFETWLRGARLVGLADGIATVTAPAHAVGVLEGRFKRQIAQALGEALGERVTVVLTD